jgi:heterodisulfide reductase subunit A-like polyferredoxin
MGLTMGMKNVFGLVKPEYRGQMHFKTGKDREMFANMLVDVYNFVEPDLTIIDGIIGMEGNGPSNGDARKFRFLGASTNAFALDTEIAKILKVEFEKVPLLKVSKERYGNIEYEVVGDMIEVDEAVKFPSSFSTNVSGTLANFMYPFFRKFVQARPIVNRDKCIACLNCKNICPAKAISVQKGKAWIDDDVCIKCFCCHEVCPINAIKINKPYIGRLLERRFNKGLRDERDKKPE